MYTRGELPAFRAPLNPSPARRSELTFLVVPQSAYKRWFCILLSLPFLYLWAIANSAMRLQRISPPCKLALVSSRKRFGHLNSTIRRKRVLPKLDRWNCRCLIYIVAERRNVFEYIFAWKIAISLFVSSVCTISLPSSLPLSLSLSRLPLLSWYPIIKFGYIFPRNLISPQRANEARNKFRRAFATAISIGRSQWNDTWAPRSDSASYKYISNLISPLKAIELQLNAPAISLTLLFIARERNFSQLY